MREFECVGCQTVNDVAQSEVIDERLLEFLLNLKQVSIYIFDYI